jgi:hypothetical protein
MTTITRYVQNHNNLIASLGVLTKEDQEKLRKIYVAKTGRPYLLLVYAKMNMGKYVTFDEAARLNPQKFSGDSSTARRRKQIMANLYDSGLLEKNPDNEEQFRITPLGVKYLYCKSILKVGRR